MNIKFSLDGTIDNYNGLHLRQVLSDANIKTGVWLYGRSEELENMDHISREKYDIIFVQNVVNYDEVNIIWGALMGCTWNNVKLEELK